MKDVRELKRENVCKEWVMNKHFVEKRISNYSSDVFGKMKETEKAVELVTFQSMCGGYKVEMVWCPKSQMLINADELETLTFDECLFFKNQLNSLYC